MVNLTGHRQAIERLYTDRATVYRYMSVKDPVTHETKQEAQAIYSDQPCRISQKALAQNSQTEAQNDVLYETKLFIAPELELRHGDMVEVIRGRIAPTGWEPIAAPRKYAAGEPFLYSTHQEVSIQRKEWA
ncbi:DUF6093 family protein [Cohnella thailandensis]|uniref:ABC transporter ATP-binding protein n=1 Tax=Cohnella thailandensis TaxID=557557 RepID=A0A841SRS2_9BACL|nr:DUF6093 family protein [Cohnella thailandensis]MBB6632765.1 ABC transporter ATP-binding protein [Cohnella thailandensis]MBP1975546.1 hypothetical protein [Cohnella thailandensis]